MGRKIECERVYERRSRIGGDGLDKISEFIMPSIMNQGPLTVFGAGILPCTEPRPDAG